MTHSTPSPSSPLRIGFVGVGNLGAKLAASLVHAGFAVAVHDRDRAAAEGLLALGAVWGDSPAAVADGADTVITCLPSPAISAAVVTGGDGVLQGLRGGGTWIEMSTTDKHEVQRIAGIAAAQGVETLEAPVTGGVHLAATGEITVIIGGDEQTAARCMPLFEAMGKRIFHVGPIGRASDIKVITNMLAFIHLVAAGEALMLSKRAGLDLGVAFEAIKQSSGNSFVHETESQVILNGSYNINFTMDLALKDLGFAMGFGREFGVPLDLAGHTYQTFIRAKEAYGGDAWSSQVVKLLEDATGTDPRAPGFPAELG